MFSILLLIIGWKWRSQPTESDHRIQSSLSSSLSNGHCFLLLLLAVSPFWWCVSLVSNKQAIRVPTIKPSVGERKREIATVQPPRFVILVEETKRRKCQCSRCGVGVCKKFMRTFWMPEGTVCARALPGMLTKKKDHVQLSDLFVSLFCPFFFVMFVSIKKSICISNKTSASVAFILHPKQKWWFRYHWPGTAEQFGSEL